MVITPRDYQDAAWKAVWDYFMKGGTGNPLIALPTGTGKTIVIALLLLNIFKRYPTQRVMVLTHSKELIDQDYKKLVEMWPGAPAGVYSAGLKRNDIGYPITVAGINSVFRRPNQFGHIDLILVDEAHLVSAKSNTMYFKFIEALKLVNPSLKVVGMTATPFRLGTGMLTDDDGLFTDIVFDLTGIEGFNWLINEGYILEVIPKSTNVKIDLDNVPIVGNEFVLSQMQTSIKKQDITYAALQEALIHGADRKSWICFSTGVEDAIESAEMLNYLGIEARAVHSGSSKFKMTSQERDDNIAALKHGDIQCLVNNNILTTGFDHPQIDLIIGLRPTMSVALWIQMVGRGTRPYYTNVKDFDLTTRDGRLACISQSPKQNCLVLDYAHNTCRLGPINDPNLPTKKKKRQAGVNGFEAPYKVCDNCMEFCHASARECPKCFEPFEMEVKIDSFASTDKLIVKELPDFTEPVLTKFEIDHITYSTHQKEGKPDSLKVTYFSETLAFNEYICLEHVGFARREAVKWWTNNWGGDLINIEVPTTVQAALDSINTLLKVPTHIEVNTDGDYPRVVNTLVENQEAPSVQVNNDGSQAIVKIDFEDDIPF